MSRAQWYVFTVIRLAALAALIWSAGSWLDRTPLSSFEKGIVEFLGITIGVFLINNWAVSHRTHLKDSNDKA
jgi:hypothetical protein